MMMMKFRRLN